MVAAELRDNALNSLLKTHPEALVSAIGTDGFRVPMPSSVGLRDEQIIPVPTDRATMLDLVVSQDALRVVTAWEQASKSGMAIGTVRTRNNPDHFLNLLLIDMRHRHGVWLGALTELSSDDAVPATGTALTASLLVPLRPRTATVRKNWRGLITGIDDRATRMLGWSAEQIVGLRSTELIHPDDVERAVANWMEMLSKREGQRVRVRHQCEDGTWLWVETENTFHDADDPEEIVVVTQLSDISDEMAAHEALDRRERLFRRLAESLPTGLLQLESDGSLFYANERLGAILGIPAATTLDEQLASVVDRDRPGLDAAITAALREGTDSELEVEVRLPGSEQLRRCAVSLTALTDQEGAPGALACVSDITESARLREELKARATFDALTGCYNRASIMALLDQTLADDQPGLTAVAFVDLDKFKPVNDGLGHAAGDELLQRAATLLTGLLGPEDLAGRLGGDEFLLVFPGVVSRAEAVAIGQRVAETLHQEVALSCGAVRLGGSVGVACADRPITADELVARADAAMYESKRQRLGAPVLYTDELRQAA
ncbi:PAS domain S-box-containing protein/diguanylate cyclase (GGDEF) domain-containing protein [Micromonospora pattaloongensis]|uniref:PAS domain S-box-containing protein/diguanylate cyclase (GGDEF) domain-containing protein n=2 Tax=Micromonospora pattaloongensis TaxID=405436 RepID=A0A1H3LLE3_9ACTN|nr:PAS domain S-box-containing protein/diguanylate cyclase (GGDEF) domain-containing protein [Micromonospora pattaloongensis]